MFLEAFLWSVSITLASYGFPYLIPSIRNRLKEIHANTELIGSEELRIKVRDSIDRTLGQLVAATCQSLMTGWSLSNLILGSSVQALDQLVIGFYIYDIVHLLTKPYGKTQRIYLLHHIAAILFIYLNTLNIHRNVFSTNISYLLMESSSATINLTTIIVHERPRYKSFVNKVNIIVYGLTRVILFPGNILYYFIDSLSSDQPILRSSELIMATLFYGLFVYWHQAMIKKYLI